MAFSSEGFLAFQLALTIVAWGLWGIFDKLALVKSEPKDVFLVTAILALIQVPIVIVLLKFLQGDWHISLPLLLYATLSTVVSSAGMALYLDAMKRADSSVVLGVTSAYPLVTQLLGLVFLGEPFSAMRAAGAVLIAAGIVLIGLTDNLSPMIWQPSTALPSEGEKKKTGVSGAFLGIPVLFSLLLVNVLWGTKGIFEKISLDHGTPLETYLSECIIHFALLGPVLLLFMRQGYRPRLRNGHLWRWVGLSELSLAIGGWAYLTALSMAPASYVVTLTSTYPIVMYILAVFVLKEKMSLLRFLALLLIVCGGLLV